MDINQQKEQFSTTYVRAIAVVAGYSFYQLEVDNDSVVFAQQRSPFTKKEQLNGIS